MSDTRLVRIQRKRTAGKSLLLAVQELAERAVSLPFMQVTSIKLGDESNGPATVTPATARGYGRLNRSRQ